EPRVLSACDDAIRDACVSEGTVRERERGVAGGGDACELAPCAARIAPLHAPDAGRSGLAQLAVQRALVRRAADRQQRRLRAHVGVHVVDAATPDTRPAHPHLAIAVPRHGGHLARRRGGQLEDVPLRAALDTYGEAVA